MKKVDIGIDNIEWLILQVTAMKLVKWEELAGEEIVGSKGKTIRCYKTKIDDIIIKTMVKTAIKHDWWRGKMVEDVFALAIEKDGNQVVFTTNAKIIPGLEVDAPNFIKWLTKSISENITPNGYVKESRQDRVKRELLETLNEASLYSKAYAAETVGK